MRYLSKRKILSALFILILAVHPLSFARIVDKIVAVVNDEIITQSEVDRVLYPLYMQYKVIYTDDEELYRELDKSRLEILKQLISDKLILCEARKIEIEVKEEEIDEQLKAVKKDLAARGMDLKSLLAEQTLALSDLRDKYREQIMIQKAIDLNIRSKIEIQPSEVSAYYRAHIEDYTQPGQVGAQTIFIKRESERTPEESRRLADDVHRMVKDCGDFKALAKNYSEGPHREEAGELGYVARGQLLKKVEDTIFSLRPGEVSDVIETPGGYHIFKIYDKREEKVLSFEEVRQKVTEVLYQAKAQDKFEEWLERLRSDAYISIK